MNRSISSTVLLLAASYLAAADNDIPKELAPFQGHWKLIDSETDGRSLTSGEPSPLRFFILRDQLRCTTDGIDWATCGTISVDPSKTPAEINLTKDKRTVAGIYKFETDRLTLVLCDTPKADRPKTFSTKDNPDVQLYLLERIKK